MIALKGYIPLTIFSTQWLKQDLLQQMFRRCTTKEKLEDSYVGMTVPVEWKMSFGEWVVAFDLFIAYLKYYKHHNLTNRFVVHKENVMDIKKENFNWPMAFRYDIAIRTTVLSIRNANGKLANPAIRDDKVERAALRDTERYGDFLPAFADIIPYADNGPKSNFNPITGKNRCISDVPTSSNIRISHHPAYPFPSTPYNSLPNGPGKPNARSWAHANQPIYNGPGGVTYGIYEDRRSGGRNTRGRGRGGIWVRHGPSGRDHSPPARRFPNNARVGERSGGWRCEERRDEGRNDDRNYNGSANFGVNSKAK